MDTETHAQTDAGKFKLYNVGLAKTGTTSITRIFNHYQAGHEFQLKETGQIIKDLQQGLITPDDVQSFLQQRDAAGNFEVDSTFCHSYYVDVLAQAFPDARFLFTIRDCYSWVDSVLNMVYTHRQITHLDLIFGLPETLLGDAAALRAHFYEYLDQLLALWVSVNTAVLNTLPADRALIIRTHEIAQKIDELAAFVGVPAETLDPTKAHEFKAAEKLHLLQEMDYAYLEAKFQEYCAPLMREFFPGYALKDFLNGYPIPK